MGRHATAGDHARCEPAVGGARNYCRILGTNLEDAITIGELGEFGLIAAVTAAMDAAAGRATVGGRATASGRATGGVLLLGAGDDAAVLRAADGRVVATTDMLIEGRHFRPEWSSAADIGHKAAARNLADIAAMGAVPTALLVGFAGPGHLAVDWVTELAGGIAAECAAVGAAVAGGDTSSAETVLLAITALGDLAGRDPVTRGGARPGDVVAVAGTLGSAAAGLDLLVAGAFEYRPGLAGLAGLDELVSAHRRPSPPYPAGPQAAVLGATSLIDVSDGLVADLGHVARASGVRIEVASSLVAAEPIARVGALQQAAELLGSTDWANWVLTGGDDHALVATFPPDVALPAAWTAVGVVAKGHGVVVDGDIFSGQGGWEHFRERGHRPQGNGGESGN